MVCAWVVGFLLVANGVRLFLLDEMSEQVVYRSLLVSVLYVCAGFPVAVVVGACELNVERHVLSESGHTKCDVFGKHLAADCAKGSVLTHELAWLMGLFALCSDTFQLSIDGLCQKLVVEFRCIVKREQCVVTCCGKVEALELTAHIMLSWRKDLVPKERLQGIEIEISLLEKANLAVVGATILLVDTINKQHVLWGKFEAAYFESEKRKGQLNYIIALHVETSIAVDAFSRHVDVNLNAAREVFGRLRVLKDFFLVSCLRVVSNFSCRGGVLNVLCSMTGREKKDCQRKYFQEFHVHDWIVSIFCQGLRR